MDILKALKTETPNICIISFLRNYGKTAALSIGFSKSRGEYVVTMDAYLQVDPEEPSRFDQLLFLALFLWLRSSMNECPAG